MTAEERVQRIIKDAFGADEKSEPVGETVISSHVVLPFFDAESSQYTVRMLPHGVEVSHYDDDYNKTVICNENTGWVPFGLVFDSKRRAFVVSSGVKE